MKNQITTILIAILFVNLANAQIDGEPTQSNWAIGAGFNIIDDSGDSKGLNIFDDDVNHFFPFVISAEYFTDNNFSFNASISFNKYKAGKTVDGQQIQEGSSAKYAAFDLASRFSFRKMLNTNVFDPYLHAGFGYTVIGGHKMESGTVPKVGRMTFNTGIGVNFWVSDSWGLNLNHQLKFGIKAGDNKDYITNQLQLSFGVFHRFKQN